MELRTKKIKVFINNDKDKNTTPLFTPKNT